MKIAAAQVDIVWHNRKANYEKAASLAAQAKDAGAELFVLPEMFPTGFSMDAAFTAEAPDGPSAGFYRKLARDLSIHVVGGLVLNCEEHRPQNAALCVGPDGEDVACYRKIHQISILAETEHYDPGDRPELFPLFGTEASMFICYDLRFPELFRSVADRCALVIVIASWPASRQSHWDILLKARAVENQCYVIGVNRVGKGDGTLFTGGSAVIDPIGTVIAQGGDTEELLLADIDPEKAWEIRSQFPFLKERKSFLMPK